LVLYFLLHPSLIVCLLGFISNQLQPQFLELFLTDHDSALVSRPSLLTGTDLLRLLKELKANYTAGTTTCSATMQDN